jgi:uncharacterized protein YukE
MEFPIGGCERSYGNPTSIRDLANAFLKTGQGLDPLIAALRQAVGSTIPEQWEGMNAQAFKGHADSRASSGEQLADLARQLAEEARVLADGLSEAIDLVRQAEQIAKTGGYYVSDNCWVTPLLPTGALDEDAGAMADILLRQARELAFAKRTHFQFVLGSVAEKYRIWMHLTGGLSLGRGAGTGRARPSLRQQVRSEFNSAQGMVQPEQRALADEGAKVIGKLPGTMPPRVDAGNLVHKNPAEFTLYDPNTGEKVPLPASGVQGETTVPFNQADKVRIDQIDTVNRQPYEIKPWNDNAIAKGELQGQSYDHALGRSLAPGQDPYSPTRVLVYDPAEPMKYLNPPEPGGPSGLPDLGVPTPPQLAPPALTAPPAPGTPDAAPVVPGLPAPPELAPPPAPAPGAGAPDVAPLPPSPNPGPTDPGPR